MTEAVILDLLKLLESFHPEEYLPPLVTAREIQDLLEISPGPDVGKAINLLRQAELQNVVKDRAEAMIFLQGLQEKGD